MKINCLVIDDEPLARKGLKEYISDVDFLRHAGSFEQPMKALDLLREGSVQLLFLDIQMPRMTGIDFFKALQHPPPVIFTTAYPQYALEGFNLNALDYLVKPVSFERFFQAALKAKEYYELRSANHTVPEEGKDYFFVKANNRLEKIQFDEILMIEALQNYVSIHTTARKFLTYLTFRAVEDFLPRNRFLKTHKSFIVAIDKVESIEGMDLTVGPHLVPISRNLKEEVMETLLRNRFLKR